jgi:ADP-ribose pyrophosphatase YjhB (NUDIX family)
MTLDDLLDGKGWYAGVKIVEEGRMLLSVRVGPPIIPSPPGATIHLRWIGGGGATGETPVACAQREAREEISCAVEIEHSHATYTRTPPGPYSRVHLTDRPAPLLHEFWERLGESSILYRARLVGEPRPGDVPALAWVPLTAIAPLTDGVPYSRLSRLGVEVLGRPSIDASAIAFIGEMGSEAFFSELVAKAPTRRRRPRSGLSAKRNGGGGLGETGGSPS